MATLDDILTAQKNGVIGINNIARVTSYLAGQITSQNYSFSRGTVLITNKPGRLVSVSPNAIATQVISISSATWASNYATITYSGTQVYTPGANVLVNNITCAGPGTFNGGFAISSASANQFSYYLPLNPGAVSSYGDFSVYAALYNAPSTSSTFITENNVLFALAGPQPVADVIPVGMQFSNGLVLTAGTGQSYSVTYSLD